MRAPNISEDAKRAAKAAAKFGLVLAILCHLLPEEYRIPCEALARICQGDMP